MPISLKQFQKDNKEEFEQRSKQYATDYENNRQILLNNRKTNSKNKVSLFNTDNLKNIVDTSALQDGYDFGDFTKSLYRTNKNAKKVLTDTIRDTGANVLKGVTNIGDSAADVAAGVVATALNAMGKKEKADKLKSIIANRQNDEIWQNFTPTGLLQKASDNSTNSALGNTSKELAQGVGYQAGLLAASGVGIPWQVVSGVSSAGSALQEAYQNGATDTEAWINAIGSAGIEIGSEYISSGIPLPGTGSLDKMFQGTDTIKNKAIKYGLQTLINLGGEGFEENVSGYYSALLKKLTYMSDKEMSELYSREDTLKDFLMGAAVTGIMQGANPSTYSAIKNNQSLLTGRTPQEAIQYKQNLDAFTQKAEENKGSKLTNEEIKNIEEYTDGTLTVEMATLQDELQNATTEKAKNEITAEINKLDEKINKIVKQTDSLRFFTQQFNQFAKESGATQNTQNAQQTQPGISVLGDQINQVNQRIEQSQEFKQTVSDINTRLNAENLTPETKFLESARNNNINVNDEGVRDIGKLASIRGLEIEFDNTKFTNSGQNAIWYETKDENGNTVRKIAVNPNSESKLTLQQIIVHEAFHDIAASETGKALIKEVLEFSKNNTEGYSDFVGELSDLYAQIKDANGNRVYNRNNSSFNQMIDEEAAANIIAQKLGNQEFINRLVAEKPSVARKFYNKIKELINKLTGKQNKTEREFWEDVADKFEKAFKSDYVSRENTKKSNDNIMFSLGKHYGDLGKGRDTYYTNMSGSRSTGHFGTGTYFVGEDYQPGQYSSYKDRPVRTVEFDNYNLFKPMTDSEGFALHDGLRALNSKEVFYEYQNDEIKSALNYYKQNLTEKSVDNLIKTLKQFGFDTNEIEQNFENGMSTKAENELVDMTEELIETADRRLRDYSNMVDVLLKNSDLTRTQIKNAFEKTREALFEYNEQGLSDGQYPAAEVDSLSTIFMKELGYDGIDVRGLKGLDNTTYGSVIYDVELSENKIQEIKDGFEDYLYKNNITQPSKQDIEYYIDKNQKNNKIKVKEILLDELKNYYSSDYNTNLNQSRVREGDLINQFQKALTPKQWKKHAELIKKAMNSTYKNMSVVNVIGNKIVFTEIRNAKEQVANIIKISNATRKSIESIIRKAENYGYTGEEIRETFREMYGEENVFEYSISNRKFISLAERNKSGGQNVENSRYSVRERFENDNIRRNQQDGRRYESKESKKYSVDTTTSKISKEGYKKLDDEFGGGKNYWEANLYDKDLNGVIYYLKNNGDVKRKFMKENNIKIEDVYKDVEYRTLGSKNEKVQNFIKDNDLTVQKLANNQKLLNEYFDLVKEDVKNMYDINDEKADEMLFKWVDYFETQKNASDTIWPLLRYERDFNNIKNGITREVDNVETANLERKLVDNNPEYEKFVRNFSEGLFEARETYEVEDVMDEAKYQHGTTDNFEVGAYMTTDGSLLDFNDGGYRDDHRTISVFDLNMQEFMNYGAIRMQPESPGFEISVEPTSEQYSRLYDYIDYLKNTRKENDSIKVDIDTSNNNYDSANYKMSTPTSKIINDIKTYFETGSFPKQSSYADFYYSLERPSVQGYLEKNFKNEGTGKTIQELKVPRVENPLIKEYKSKTLNPIEISNLTPEDANTTPKLLNINRNKVSDGESSFWNNIGEKTNMLNDSQKSAILQENEVKYYDKITNKESLEKAFKKLNDGGQNETMSWFNKASKTADATDVAEGWILLKQYADSGNTEGMVEVAKKMRDIGTQAGQTVQAFNILQRLTPEGMVAYAQSELSDAYDKMVKNKTQKWIDENASKFQLTSQEVRDIMDIMQEVQDMEDGYEKKVKLAQVQKIVTDKLPPEKGGKIKAWMRISMLFNPKTQVRNVAGNAIIAPVNFFGDIVGSLTDKQLAKKTGVRTTGNVNIKSILKGFKEGAYQATNDYKLGINTKDMEGNRFEIGEGKSFNDNTVIGKSLNRVEGLLNYVMDVGDRVFSQAWFENSLQNQMELNNTTEVTKEMIDIARNEALSRTWNDNNGYTKLVLGARKGLNANMQYGVGDMLIPFAKTPANLTKAIVDYSPAGMIKALVEGHNLKNAIETGQFTSQQQHKFVQDLGKATAGSMLYAIGLALAMAGISSGKSDDDKDTANFLKNTLGISSYSLKIGGKSFTYDWAQPIAAPLSITANIVQSKADGINLIESILSNLDTAGSILLEQSFLQSISEVLNNNDGVVSGLMQGVLELPSRAIPTFSKQFADLTDSTARQTFEYNKPLKSALNKVVAKLPGLSKTLAPSVDTMGREIQRYGGKNNVFNVFLNPANVNIENVSASAAEIYRVSQETGDKTIMPKVAPYYVTKKGEKKILTSAQKAEYQKISGSMIEEEVGKLLSNATYNMLSGEEQAKMIKNIVDLSYNIAQSEVLGTDISSTYNKAYQYSKVGNISDFYLTKIKKFTADKDEEGNSIKGSEKNKTVNYINSLNLSIVEKAMLIKMNGYNLPNYNNDIINYVNSKPLSVKEKTEILSALGFTVKNGRVYS